MYSGQQNQPPNQYPQQQYQQYPQQQPGYPPQQYQQAPAPMPQPMPQQAPQPAAPAKDTVVAEEFKRYVASITWQVGDHQQYPGQHIIKISPPGARKLMKGDVKKAQITIRAMGPQAPAPGVPSSGANSIQVSIDTEEKAGIFGSDKKTYPIWLNADEEVDNNMQPTAGLKEKIRDNLTKAKVMMPPPPPPQAPAAPPQQPQQWAQPQPGAPAQGAPQPAPGYQQPPPQAQPQYQQPSQQAPQQYQQPAAPPPAYQQQPAPQYQQPMQQQQYGAPAPGYGSKMCANPNCRTANAANATTCFRCGYQLQ